MTKAQAVQIFKEECLPIIRKYEQEYGHRKDPLLRVQEWNAFTDMLCKDKHITKRQYDTWTIPNIC
jgi:hypothetical protein